MFVDRGRSIKEIILNFKLAFPGDADVFRFPLT
jgi:hypothetical protein